jgi:hypothetical protein
MSCSDRLRNYELDADDDVIFVLLGVKKSLYGLAERLMGLRESVAEKRAEVDTMRREKRLFSVVNVQVRRI